MRDGDDKEAGAKGAGETAHLEEFAVAGLSRRALLDRMKALGVGFGAAYMLGVNSADAAAPSGGTARLRSSNDAVNNIIEEGESEGGRIRMADSPGDQPPGEQPPSQPPGEQPPSYSRGSYSRGSYSRGGYSRGYARGYQRGYSKGYQRAYSKGYQRGYSKGYRRSYSKGYARVYRRSYSRGYSRGSGPRGHR